MTEIYITSDQHFFHKNILKYQPDERPFDDILEMNECIIERWNEVVKPKDHVYSLGDFAFAKAVDTEAIAKRLNGKKFLIQGNHDHTKNVKALKNHFEWVKPYHSMMIDKQFVVMFHYPIHSWDRMQCGSYHFYGHTHGQVPHLYHGRAMDVGVDTNGLFPYNIRYIFELYDNVAKLQELCEGYKPNIDPRGRSEIR